MFVTLLLSAAGLAAGCAARLRRARTRWIWVLTILISLALPSIIASVSVQVPILMPPTVSRKLTALREMTFVQVTPLTRVSERTAAAPNRNRTL
jgi:bla regulator protein BlaR1